MASRMASCIFCKIIKGMYRNQTPLLSLALRTLMAVEWLQEHERTLSYILTGDIPSFKLFESDKTLAFLDINPLSKGHAVCHPHPHIRLVARLQASPTHHLLQLVIPKHHGEKLTDIPDDSLTELLVRLLDLRREDLPPGQSEC